jgi:hypothetical protein
LKNAVCRASSKARHYQGNARWKRRFLDGLPPDWTEAPGRSRRRDQMKRFPVVRDGSPITVRDEGPMVRAHVGGTRCRRRDAFPHRSLSAMFSPFSKPLGNL